MLVLSLRTNLCHGHAVHHVLQQREVQVGVSVCQHRDVADARVLPAVQRAPAQRQVSLDLTIPDISPHPSTKNKLHMAPLFPTSPKAIVAVGRQLGHEELAVEADRHARTTALDGVHKALRRVPIMIAKWYMAALRRGPSIPLRSMFIDCFVD